MILKKLFIFSYITYPFCGTSPCLPCPEHGTCNGFLLKCKKPFVPARYECAEKESIRSDLQKYLEKAEVYMLQQSFLNGSLVKTETELFLETDANTVIFEMFVGEVKNGNSKVLMWSKDKVRKISVKLDNAYWVGAALLVDLWDVWILGVMGIVLVFVLAVVFYRVIAKVKVD